jgi:hypothetical protein
MDREGGKGMSVQGIRGLVRRGSGMWNESPHILAGTFRANKNGCRVSRGIDGQCDGGGGTSQRFEGGGRWRGESEIRKHQGQTRKGQGKEGEGSEGVRRIEWRGSIHWGG